jgi:hypothetical protein
MSARVTLILSLTLQLLASCRSAPLAHKVEIEITTDFADIAQARLIALHFFTFNPFPQPLLAPVRVMKCEQLPNCAASVSYCGIHMYLEEKVESGRHSYVPYEGKDWSQAESQSGCPQ